MVSWLERSLDEAAAARPNPGRVALHRLNRAEYAAAIEDLLGLTIDAAALLPKDDEAEGFDNVASVLTVSPSFLDQYISAARVVSARAIGNPAARPGSMTYRPARGTDQSVRVDGLPLGTRGGLHGRASFPGGRRLQAEYPQHGHCRLRAGHGVSPHAHRHHRRREGVREHDRRRGRHQGHRSAAGARRRGDQRALHGHPDQGDRRTAQGRA